MVSDVTFKKINHDDKNIIKFTKQLYDNIDNQTLIKLPGIEFKTISSEDSYPSEASTYFLIYLNNTAIGFLEYDFGYYYKNAMFLKSIFIDKQHRHKGYGKQALDFFKTQMQNLKDVHFLMVNCNSFNKSFYEHNGFSVDIGFTKAMKIK